MDFDEQMMQRCIQLASLGLGLTYPNPLVGCVIVHDGKILAEGWHQKAGCSHAEVNAIRQIQDKEVLKNSTLYVSLEPCAHHGKTPPCADLIVEHQIPRVVIGTVDPFAKVNGLGVQKLKNAGIEVKIGVLEHESRELNKRFFTFHEEKRPYIILKWAQTADGYMGSLKEEQKWITNSFSKQLVHKWRAEEQGILVGFQTAKIDNPQLNLRLWEGNPPTRFVLDRNLELDHSLYLFDQTQPTIVFTEKEKKDVKNLKFLTSNFGSDFLQGILREIYEQEIQSIIVEGGRKTLDLFIGEGIWDEARVFSSSHSWREGIQAPQIKGDLQLEKKIGEDTVKIWRK
jgi:diaminohydroxyphosphoribosylaminopyrimidine deaminase/5-amino-6-(5-phosphoribosylamino)uracil reductase